MYLEDKCSCCSSSFTQANIAKIMSSCSHNICSNCLKQLITQKATKIHCQKCNQTFPVDQDELESFPKNITILKQLRDSGLGASVSLNSEVTEKRTSLSEEKDKSQTSLLIAVSALRSLVENCATHGKPLDVICTVDKNLLCPHCALFGQHRNHELKTLDEFQEELQNSKNGFKDIRQRFKVVNEETKSREFKSKMVDQMDKKKESLLSEVKQKFTHAMQIIKAAETKACNQITDAFVSINQQLNKVSQEPNTLQKNYEIWYRKTKGILDQVESAPTIKEKVGLVYENILNMKDGEFYIKQIIENNKNMRENLESMISSIRVDFSISLEGYIANYARISLSHPQLTSPDHLIQMIPQSLDPPREPKRKPIKAEFVKSEEMILVKKNSEKNPSRVQSRDNSRNRARQGMASPGARAPRQSFKASSQKDLQRRGSQIKKDLPKQLKRNAGTKQLPAQMSEIASKVLKQFKKSTETLDLTGYEMTDTEIIDIIAIAVEEKQIKCIKVCKNKLTNIGLSKMLQYLSSATNINMSYNSLTDGAVDEFINRRERLPHLRIINLSHNQLNERRVQTKIDQLKRMGIIATL